MPSIEFVCVGQREPTAFPALPFAVRADQTLLSDRSPSPLFQHDFDQLQGCIYHLASPFCAAPGYAGAWFAYELLSEPCREATPARFLEFAPECVAPLVQMLGLLLAASSAALVIITTDWQGGPHPARRYRPITERTFWQRHASRRLHLNALYPVRPAV